MIKNKGQHAMQYLKDSLKYYDKKSISCKRWYTALISADVILSAFIPFATLFFDDYANTKFIVALMGSLVTIASSVRAKFAFQEDWVEYRTTTEILKYHRYLYDTLSPPYNKKNKDELLITKVNEICMNENKCWRDMKLNNSKKPDEDPDSSI